MVGGSPQSFINTQGVDTSDIVIALSGGRLGSPTLDAVSGSVEEIERAVDAGKPVHVFFSTAPLPVDVDSAQLDGLRAFKRELPQRGLLGEFSTEFDLGERVWQAIEHDVSALELPPPEFSPRAPRDNLLVQSRSAREVSGYDAKGAPRYRTRRWVEVSNQSEHDAENVVATVAEGSGIFLAGFREPTVIHAGQTRDLHLEFSLGTGDDPTLTLAWDWGDTRHEEQFHIG